MRATDIQPFRASLEAFSTESLRYLREVYPDADARAVIDAELDQREASTWSHIAEAVQGVMSKSGLVF